MRLEVSWWCDLGGRSRARVPRRRSVVSAGRAGRPAAACAVACRQRARHTSEHGQPPRSHRRQLSSACAACCLLVCVAWAPSRLGLASGRSSSCRAHHQRNTRPCSRAGGSRHGPAAAATAVCVVRAVCVCARGARDVHRARAWLRLQQLPPAAEEQLQRDRTRAAAGTGSSIED
jgi:hypothetical protein